MYWSLAKQIAGKCDKMPSSGQLSWWSSGYKECASRDRAKAIKTARCLVSASLRSCTLHLKHTSLRQRKKQMCPFSSLNIQVFCTSFLETVCFFYIEKTVLVFVLELYKSQNKWCTAFWVEVNISVRCCAYTFFFSMTIICDNKPVSTHRYWRYQHFLACNEKSVRSICGIFG